MLTLVPQALAGDGTATEDAVREVLERRRGEPAPTHEELVAGLVELGSGHARPALGMLLQVQGSDGFDEDAGEPLADEDRLVLEDALTTWPRRAVLDHAVKVARGRSNSFERIDVARVVLELDLEGSLKPVLRILNSVPGPEFRSRHVSSLADRYVRTALEREPDVLRVRREIDRLEPYVLGCVSRCLIERPTDDALELLFDVVDRGDDLAVEILQGVRSLERPRARAAHRLGLTRVLELVEHPAPAVRKVAFLTLGDWREADAVPDMITALDGEHRGVARAAATALRETSGLAWPGDAGRWRRWYDDELAWLEGAAHRYQELLGEGDAPAAVAACRELGNHAVWRRTLTPWLEVALMDEDLSVVHAGCRALRRLGADEAVPLLIPLLEDLDESVAVAAQEALKGIVGTDLGTHPHAWWVWLEEGLRETQPAPAPAYVAPVIR